jgi:hypothetical protein
MLNDINRQFSSYSFASPHRCLECPPERICAWACVQGASVEEIVVGAMLTLEDRASPALPFHEPDIQPITEAIWDSYNV